MSRPHVDGTPRVRDGYRLEEYLPIASLRTDDHLHPITLQRRIYEGYPSPEYSIEGLRAEDLQRFADWLIVQPRESYEPLANLHRALERALIADRKDPT